MSEVPVFDSPRGAIVAIREAERDQYRAEARKLAATLAFADHYRHVDDDNPWLHGQRLVVWGGEGCPPIAEYCSLELAAACRLSEEAAMLDIRDAQSLHYRFPLLWGLIMAGEVRVFKAREITQLALPLNQAHAAELDRIVADNHATMSWRRLLNLVKAFVTEHDALGTDLDYERERSYRNVSFRPAESGITQGIEGRIDTADAIFLNAQLDRLATILRETGATDSHQVLRAKALGVLASPARALQLLQASLQGTLTELEVDPDCPALGQRGHTCGRVTVDPNALLPKAQVTVHISDETLAEQCGTARIEGVGPLLATWPKELLGHTRVTLRPVFNPDQIAATDAYEIPAHQREWVALRNPHEAFPFSHKATRLHGRDKLDLDHTTPWRSNPPAPLTRPDNLGPLSRKVHRAKTSRDWQVHQVRPGVFWWQSPLGFEYLVTPSHTLLVTDPTRRLHAPEHSPALAA